MKLCIFRDLGFKIELLKADGKVETLDSMGTVDQGTLMLPVGAKEALLEALLSAGVKPKVRFPTQFGRYSKTNRPPPKQGFG